MAAARFVSATGRRRFASATARRRFASDESSALKDGFKRSAVETKRPSRFEEAFEEYREGRAAQTLTLSAVQVVAERKIEEWDAWSEHVSDLLKPGETDWGRGIHVCLDGLRNQPGGIAIRRAMGASPTLRELDREDNVRLARRFSAAIVAVDPSVDAEQAAINLRVTLEAVMAVLDITYDMPKAEADAHVAACVAMQSAYLERCFPGFGGNRR